MCFDTAKTQVWQCTCRQAMELLTLCEDCIQYRSVTLTRNHCGMSVDDMTQQTQSVEYIISQWKYVYVDISDVCVLSCFVAEYTGSLSKHDLTSLDAQHHGASLNER